MGRRKTFNLDKRNGKFMGVCAGIAGYFNIDATFVRIGAVLATIIGGFPWTVIAYFVAAWLAKPKPVGYSEGDDIATLRGTRDDGLRARMRDIDRRMADVESYVTTSNSTLSREIEELR
jgi:phage shock protein C